MRGELIMKKQLVIAVISVVAAAGCGSKNTSSGNGELQSGSGGTCSAGYTKAFSTFYANAKEVASYYDDNGDLTPDARAHPSTVIAAYKSLDNSCDAFLVPYGDVSCTAIRSSDGNMVEVVMPKVKTICAAAKSVVHPVSGKTTETSSEELIPENSFDMEADAFMIKMK